MRIEMLERWLNSPIPGRRRKAVKRLLKEALRERQKIGKYFEEFLKLTDDEDWSVRAASLHACVELAKVDKSLTDRVFDKLLERATDSSANVRAVAIRGISELISPERVNRRIYDICVKAMGDENNDVKLAALELALKLCRYDENFFKKHCRDFIQVVAAEETVAPLKEVSLRILAENIDRLDEKTMTELKDLVVKATKHRDFRVRVAALSFLLELYRKKKISADELKTVVRKRLRDEAVPVKSIALEIVDSIISDDARRADDYLDIISLELLRKEKNLRLKIKALEMLEKWVDRIPTEIINRHEVPRTLDLLDKLTVEKKAELARIKQLARYILEQKLGYTFEKRRKLWGEKEIRKLRKWGGAGES